MPKLPTALPPNQPDSGLLDTLALANRVCLTLASSLAVVNLARWLIPALDRIFPGGWQHMTAGSALTVVISAFSLHLSAPRHSRRMHQLSQLLAALVTLLAIAFISEYVLREWLGIHELLPSSGKFAFIFSQRLSHESAGCFALLGIAMTLIHPRGRLAVRLADLFTFLLCLLVMVLVSGYIFGASHMFGPTPEVEASPETLVCLILLTLAAVLRRAGKGVFSIFLGRGIGSRIARVLSPILLILPFLRETARARIIGAGRMPPHYATAILASMAAVLSLALLLFLAWRINNMETEIHDLSLRDELTGLYNLRGFRLLAEQALRLAQRSNLPFSVLFIDLDGLKQTNDSLGHDTGSKFLAETGEMLEAIFRETDVIGRIGGDEFAVAGQFSTSAISVAAERLMASSTERNTQSGRRFVLSFSMGHVTSDGSPRESLHELLAKADQAMYQAKRLKKSPRR